MKFTDYLEAIKSDVYNELFNIDTSKLKMKKIEKLINFDFAYMFFDIFKTENKIKEENFFLDRKNIESRVLKSFKNYETNTKLIKKNVKTFIKYFYKLRDGNYYIEDYLGNIHRYVFFVNKKIYQLSGFEAQEDYPISIEFGEYNKKYSANSIMSSKEDSSALYGKIRGIVENELPDWEKRIFSFTSIRENKETEKDLLVEKFFNTASSIINNFLKSTTVKDSYVKEFMTIYDGLSNNKIKIKSKDLIFLGIKNTSFIDNNIKPEVSNLFQEIFNKSKILPKATKKSLKKVNNTSNEYFGKEKIKGISASDVARTRIYRIIIKQMFGDKVFIKESGRSVIFSLSPIPDDIE